MSNIDLIKKHNFNFAKKFGQNFIFDKNLLSAIVNDAGITNQTQVVEIGAGAGSLTKILSTKAKHVTSFEIDQNLKPILEEVLQDTTNVTLHFKDILKQDVAELEKQLGQNYVIVANLPYYITTPIIFKFVEEAQMLSKMVIMVQKEVAERLVAKQGTKDYGQITVTLGAISDIKIARIVNRQMFIPAPNVDSAIVVIDFNKNKFEIENQKVFRELVKGVFAQRRKTLSNNIKNTFNLDTQQIENLLKNLNLQPSTRGETLTIEQFVKLSNIIAKNL